MQQYGSQIRLMNNQSYKIKFNLPGIISKSWSFTSRYSPFYTTIKAVEGECGTVLDSLDNTKKAAVIYSTSLLCDQILINNNIDEPNQVAIKEFTKYKSAIPLVNIAAAKLIAEAGSESKKLGNLSIEKRGYTKIDLSKLIAHLEKMAAYWEAKLSSTGMTKSIVGAVRANKNYGYPLNSRIF